MKKYKYRNGQILIVDTKIDGVLVFRLVSLLIIIICLLIAPFILWLVSKKNDIEKLELNKEANDELSDVAYRTWLYFDNLLNEEDNYLIPDNYQVSREIKEDYKTSPTDIGMSLTAIVSACELDFIKRF